MKAKRIGDSIKVINKQRKLNAAAEYFYVRIQAEDGSESEYLFTEKELANAKARAQKNPEDLPKIGWIRDLLD